MAISKIIYTEYLEGDASPQGVVSQEKGSKYKDLTTGIIYKNEGGTDWNIDVDGGYYFNATIWGINSDATNNKTQLQAAINFAKEKGYYNFIMDDVDFYVKTDGDILNDTDFIARAINIPSDFNIIMTETCHIRVEPNDNKSSLIFSFDSGVRNSSIKGGNLYGDRDNHDYTTNPSTHEWGYLVSIIGASDIMIQGVNMTNATGDCITVSGYKLRTEIDYIPCENIYIINNNLSLARRNNISVTDGNNIIIENNIITDAGKLVNSIDGTAPRLGIDMEAYRIRDGAGVLTEYERVENVVVRNNKFTENINGAANAYTCYNVLIENNYSDTGISYSNGNQIKIKGNTLIAEVGQSNQIAIQNTEQGFTYTPEIEIVKDNEISGNIIDGFEWGMSLRSHKNKVFSNQIYNFDQGINVYQCKNSEIYDNKISSDITSSRGVTFTSFADNVKIYNNIIVVDAEPFYCDVFNSVEVDYQIYEVDIYDNHIESLTDDSSFIRSAYGFNFIRNRVIGYFYISTSNNINIIGNDILGDEDGIEFFGAFSDINIKQNNIETTSTEFLTYAILMPSGTNANTNVTIADNRITQSSAYRSISITGANNDGWKVYNNIGDVDGVSLFLEFVGNNSIISFNRTILGLTDRTVTGTGNTEKDYTVTP